MDVAKDKNWEILSKDPSWVPGPPRNSAVAHFRLLTSHDCLRSHVYRIGAANSPDCLLCDSGLPMSAEHLIVCPAIIRLSSIAGKYWRARALMS
ncbi:hypothetical protein TNCV_2309081 [Trichonephila clavipes]|nr:hypothetical protein TNCV_2309081 [Trichonephila clavipes]